MKKCEKCDGSGHLFFSYDDCSHCDKCEGRGMVKTMNVVIYINETYEEEQALYDVDSQKVLLKGDYYHDKISAKISGYLIAKNIEEDEVEDIYIDQNHELFKVLEFYDGSED